jgi:hypothetical protein
MQKQGRLCAGFVNGVVAGSRLSIPVDGHANTAAFVSLLVLEW